MSKPLILNEEECWQQLIEKNLQPDAAFIYAVKTTQIYCLPGCRSKLPKRENVEFFSTCSEAENAGYRACKRCRPDEQAEQNRHQKMVAEACQLMATSTTPFSLAEIAAFSGLSPWHFHRIFKAILGVTPKQYSDKLRTTKLSKKLIESNRISDAIYAAGFESSSRAYEKMQDNLGMTASNFKKGGKNLMVQYALTDCFLGRILVASTNKGICTIAIADSDADLIAALEKQLPNATYKLAEETHPLTQQLAQVIQHIEFPENTSGIPLDIIGTAFQQRVWALLQKIPVGSTETYAEIAKRMGQPTAVRAVARACASNNIAIIIPCHRVIGSTGKLTGYRWGLERKAQLLQHEEACLSNAKKKNIDKLTD